MIDVNDAGVTIGDITLLSPVSVRVKAGETLVVRGENGSGKTTLLRVLAGSQRPSTGVARLDGKPINERERGFRRRVAAMIGLPPMAPDLTVFDHVAFVATTWLDSVREVEQATQGVLADLGLTTLGRRFVHELSSGQIQLFGLALVLVRPCDVLVLDEPEQRLDPGRISLVARTLNARRAAGATLIVATHSVQLADAIADRTLVLESAA